MIKEKDVRIGNLVMYDGDVYEIAPTDYAETEFDRFGPIPLTEEWLEKIGFVEKYNHNADGDEVNWMEYERKDVIGNNYLCYKDGQINLFHGQLNITPCKFVHDLQNLYFALTGEELTIKEPA